MTLKQRSRAEDLEGDGRVTSRGTWEACGEVSSLGDSRDGDAVSRPGDRGGRQG